MANGLTQAGQSACLYGTGTPNGGFANIAAFLKLFLSTSTPNKDPGIAVWNLVTPGNGYAPIAIARGNWTLGIDGGNSDQQLTLATQVVTATGPISNVEGAVITDAAGNVLAWFDRGAAANLLAGDTFTMTGLNLELQ